MSIVSPCPHHCVHFPEAWTAICTATICACIYLYIPLFTAHCQFEVHGLCSTGKRELAVAENGKDWLVSHSRHPSAQLQFFPFRALTVPLPDPYRQATRPSLFAAACNTQQSIVAPKQNHLDSALPPLTLAVCGWRPRTKPTVKLLSA